MGHDLPEALCRSFVELIAGHAKRALSAKAAE
jgi:hypothetical protein